MKKSVRILAVVMAVLMVTFVFASCGTKLSGEYSNMVEAFGVESGSSYEFSGSKVTISVKLAGAQIFEAEGTYEIDDDEITFTFESDDEDAKDYSGTFDFEEGDDYIKIAGIKYEKAE